MRIANSIDVNLLENPFEWGWNALTALFTGIMMLTALAALTIAIFEYYSKNRAYIEVIEKDTLKQNKRRKALLRNTGKSPAYKVILRGQNVGEDRDWLHPGGEIEIDYSQSVSFSDLDDVSYKFLPWWPKRTYLIRSDKREKRRKDLVDIDSIDGRIKLRRLLQFVSRNSKENSKILLSITENLQHRATIEVRFENKEGCYLTIKLMFASRFDIAAYILSSILEIDPIVEVIGYDQKITFGETVYNLDRIIKKHLCLHRIIFRSRPETDYVSRIRAVNALVNLGKDPFEKEFEKEIGIKRSRNLGDRSILFTKESDRNSTSFSKQIPILSNYYIEDEVSFIIVDSRLSYAAASKFQVFNPELTILDKKTRVINSSHILEINCMKLSQAQFQDFTLAFRELKGLPKFKAKRHVKRLVILKLRIENTIEALRWRPKCT